MTVEKSAEYLCIFSVWRKQPGDDRMDNDYRNAGAKENVQQIPRHAFQYPLTPGIAAVAKDLHLLKHLELHALPGSP
jgi:hypothetical protein